MRSASMGRMLGVGLALAAVVPQAMAADASAEKLDAMARQIQALQAQVDALRQETEAARAELARMRGGRQAVPAPADDDVSAVAADDASAVAAETGDTAVAAAVGDGSASGGGANAFNPAITLILNGAYTHHSRDPGTYARAGFPIVGEGGPAPQGLSLGESEVSLAANIDDKFYGQFTMAVGTEDGQDELGVEEAYIDTTALPKGFSLRMGRFFSNIGYLNSHHAHTDNFFDRPLAYQAFLGNQYGDDGVQLRWVAPTSVFLEFGGELFRGDRFPAGGAQHGGIGARSLFAHVGGSAGTENEWLFGVSSLRTKAANAEDGFNGDNRLLVADATWKWAPAGNFKDGGVTLRGEYFREVRDGLYIDPDDSANTAPWSGTRRGGYLEAVYRLNRVWDIGYRYDRLWGGDNGPFAAATDPERHSAEVTWRNSEFSLFRLQLSRDTPDAGDSDTAVTLQYQTSLGAHGAHKF